MKIALGIEYAGYNYYGWQKQSIFPTIQETVESALSDIANEIVNVYCAGRTDTLEDLRVQNQLIYNFILYM